MATPKWVGGAPTQAEINDWTFGGTWASSSSTVTFTIGAKAVTVTIGSTVISTFLDTLVSAWNALSATLYPEYAELTASKDGTTDFRLTADTAGKQIGPITITTNDGTGTIGSQTVVTANRGPNDWASPMNWSTGAIPVSTDDPVIEDTNDEILYGLDQNAVDLTSMTIRRFSGKLGLPLIGTDAAGTEYPEYRQKDLKIGFATLNFGQPEYEAECTFANIDGDATAFTANVSNTGTSSDTTRYALRLRGTSTSNVLNIVKGEIDFATQAGESSALATLRTGYVTSLEGDVKVRLGSGVSTLTTTNINGGRVEMNSNTVTINQTAGELFLMGTMTVTTLNVEGGICHYRSNGTCTTLNVGSGGTLDAVQDLRSRTVTNLNLYEGYAFSDPNRTITPTNGYDFVHCAPNGNFDIGEHVTLTPSAI